MRDKRLFKLQVNMLLQLELAGRSMQSNACQLQRRAIVVLEVEVGWRNDFLAG